MEPNAVPGFTHRSLARFVARALVSFPETARWFPQGPRRSDGPAGARGIFRGRRRSRAATMLTVLITGGSQGSRTLNRAAEESWPLWKKGRGPSDPSDRRAPHTTNSRRDFAPRACTARSPPFLDDMPRAFAEADLVVSRAGMGAVSELAAAGKPSILVPLPTASDQHQLRNAEAFEKAGAARLVLDAEMTGARLVEEVMRLGRGIRGCSRKWARRRAPSPTRSGPAGGRDSGIACVGDQAIDKTLRKPKQYNIEMFFKPQPVHFVGIGGIGMSGLAEVLLELGYRVSGSDLKLSPATERLAARGAVIFEGHAAANVGGAKAVVVSSAVRADNPEVVEARRLAIPGDPARRAAGRADAPEVRHRGRRAATARPPPLRWSPRF